jgi:hypothetical protein
LLLFEAPKHRSTILFDAPILLFEALPQFEAPTSCCFRGTEETPAAVF